jgi:hypothetical protein
MIKKIENLKEPLAELASLLNAFKSETVQLRILEHILDNELDSEASGHEVKSEKRAVDKRSAVKRGARRVNPSARRGTIGSGATATLTQLVGTSFFDKSRTINDLVEHCKHSLARTFKPNDFSGYLGRLVRAGTLSRKKNADKQYEYKKV